MSAARRVRVRRLTVMSDARSVGAGRLTVGANVLKAMSEQRRVMSGPRQVIFKPLKGQSPPRMLQIYSNLD